MPNNITLKNGAVVTIGFHENEIPEILEVVRDFCGFEFWRYANEKIAEMTDYETMRFNSDFDAYEEENEQFRNTLQEIESLLQQYEDKLDHGGRVSRKAVERLFEQIHDQIKEVI